MILNFMLLSLSLPHAKLILFPDDLIIFVQTFFLFVINLPSQEVFNSWIVSPLNSFWLIANLPFRWYRRHSFFEFYQEKIRSGFIISDINTSPDNSIITCRMAQV